MLGRKYYRKVMREGLVENLGIIFLLILIKGDILNHINEKSTQEIALRYSVITQSTQFLASILRSHVWLRKALEPGGQIVDCCSLALLVGTLHIISLGSVRLPPYRHNFIPKFIDAI